MGRPRRYAQEIPRPPIEAVLKELGADDVPTGYGWCRMRCPFHEDNTPSAAVNHEQGGFACHSCGRRGDSLKLLQSELGLTFKEACDRARALLGEETTSRGKPARKRRASDLLNIARE